MDRHLYPANDDGHRLAFMRKTRKLSAIVHKEGKWYVSLCPELDIASQGKTVEQAVSNLQEAVQLYLDEEDITLPESHPIVTMFEVNYGKASRAARA
jgi:predicted RNase H-like HicB family nuclease